MVGQMENSIQPISLASLFTPTKQLIIFFPLPFPTHFSRISLITSNKHDIKVLGFFIWAMSRPEPKKELGT